MAATKTRQSPELQRKRVTVFCVGCKDFFRYIYPGTGSYRSLCKHCKTSDPRPYGKH